MLNGNEIGGGSIRNHRPEAQSKVFELLGISAERAEQNFSFLLRALAMGAPPHGGIAFGLDRLAMLVAGVESLREVIAFPKAQGGVDPLTGSPSLVTPGCAGRNGPAAGKSSRLNDCSRCLAKRRRGTSATVRP